MTSPPRRKRQRAASLFLGIAVLISVPASAVAAAPIDDKRAQAARVERELDEQGRQVSMLAERYNRAKLKLDQIDGALAQSQSDLTRSEQRMGTVRQRLAQAAVLAYVQGGSSTMLGQLARPGAGGSGEMVVRRQYLRMTAINQRQLMGDLRSAREDIGSRRSELESARRTAKEASTAADTARRQAMAGESRQRALLRGVKGELAQLVAAAQARREAEAARRPTTTGGSPGLRGLPPTVLGPLLGSGRGAVAVAEAAKHLGKPYLYGGSGPGSFDCSGLTSFAWRAAGVRLSHSAYTQYMETTRVPLSDIQPGDLVFFGPSVSGIHHNALYIGGGQMIEASRTGTPIRVRAWRGADLVGIGRPG
ncbi:MAG: NlpC/P60 family protein [Acidimicrobiales bacterium]